MNVYADFPPMQKKIKKNAAGPIPPRHPTPTRLSPLSVLSAAFMRTEWVQRIIDSPALWKLRQASELSWLFVWTHAPQKGRVVSEWFCYTGPVVSLWALGLQSIPTHPRGPYTHFFNSHWHANVLPVDELFMASRLLDKPSLNFLACLSRLWMSFWIDLRGPVSQPVVVFDVWKDLESKCEIVIPIRQHYCKTFIIPTPLSAAQTNNVVKSPPKHTNPRYNVSQILDN